MARTIVITGASDGIGAASARQLTDAGEQVVIVGRNPEKMSVLRDAFPADYDLRVLSSPQDIDSVERIPTVTIGTVPANQPIDEGIKGTLDALFVKAKSEKTETEAPIGSLPTGGKRILLEMAYKPAVTELIRLAEGAGWATVNGLEVLVGQGVKQFE